MWFLIWLIPLILILVLIGWVLVAPIQLRVDTIRGIFDVRMTGIVRAWLELKDDRLRVRLRVFFIPVRIGKGKKKADPEPEQAGKRRKKKRKRSSMGKAIKYGWAVLHTFRVKRFRLELDTEDDAVNAQLYGWAYILRSRGMEVEINFEGRNELVLVIENRAGRMLWAFVRTRLNF